MARPRFRKGTSGNKIGRPKGSLNKATLEVKAFARLVIYDSIYRRTLMTQARAGKLHPAVHTMLYHYACGVPKQVFEVESRERVPLFNLPAGVTVSVSPTLPASGK